MVSQDEQSKKISTDIISIESTPGEINTTVVNITKYKLFVGFEVNYPDAYKNGTMDIMVDPGHAFFYVTNRDIVELFFSFGPLAPPVDGEDATEKRPSTISYPIKELAKLFRLTVTEGQVNKIKSVVNEMEKRVTNGDEPYWVKANDTCAAKAKEVLDDSGIKTPEGKGPVIASGNDFSKKVLSVMKMKYVNPYQWYSDFKKQFGLDYIYYGPEGEKNLVKGSGFELQKSWMLKHGMPAPIFT